MDTTAKFMAVLVGLALIALPPGLASAEEPHGCGGFKWPADGLQAALTASALPSVPSGASREASTSAFVLALRPAANAGLPEPPERASNDPATFAGFVTIAPPARAGVYQVTLDTAAWIDATQSASYLKPQAFSGALDCKGVRKMVRFDLEAVPLTLQVSGVAVDHIGLIVSPVD